MRELMIHDENKKERLLKLAKILRETDTPISGAILAEELSVSRSTITRYLRILENHLDSDEKLDTTTDENGTCFYRILCLQDKYSHAKNEEGYPDPTAATAMNNLVKEDKTVRDWKYNPGDIWLSKAQNKRYETPFLILGVYSEKTLCVKAYELSDVNMGMVDLNDPNLVEIGHWYIDTSDFRMKKFAWFTEKSGQLDDEGFSEVKRKIARALHICENDEIASLKKELEDANKKISDLMCETKALERSKQYKASRGMDELFNLTPDNLRKKALNSIFGQKPKVDNPVVTATNDDYWNGFLRGRLATYDRVADILSALLASKGVTDGSQK